MLFREKRDGTTPVATPPKSTHGRIRICDDLLRRQTFYPTELSGHGEGSGHGTVGLDFVNSVSPDGLIRIVYIRR